MSECRRSLESFETEEEGRINRKILNGCWIWWCYEHNQPIAWCVENNLKQQQDALQEFARNFFEWHANHFEDFSTEINAQLLSLANTVEPLIASTEKQA